MNTNALSLTGRSFKTPQDIIVVVDQNRTDIQERVVALEKNLYSIDVNQVTVNLSQAGSALKVAYAGSMAHRSHNQITGILLKYQVLIKESTMASNSFVQSCLQTLKWQALSLDLLSRQQPDHRAALEVLSRCADVAAKMAIKSRELAGKSQELCELAGKSLQEVGEERTSDLKKKTEIKQRIADMKARQAELKSLMKDNTEQLNAEKLKEKEAKDRAATAHRREFAITMVSTFIKPVAEIVGTVSGVLDILKRTSAQSSSSESKKQEGELINRALEAFQNASSEAAGVEQELEIKKKQLAREKEKKDPDEKRIETLNDEILQLEVKLESKKKLLSSCESALNKAREIFQKQAAQYDEQEQKAFERASAIRKIQREQNAELASSVEKLCACQAEGDDLGAAIHSLDTAATALGKVTTVFLNTGIFWQQVADHCERLKQDNLDLTQFGRPDETEKFKGQLESEMWSWMVLGKVTWVAHEALKDVDKNSDQIISNLPSSRDAKEIVQRESQKLKLDMANEEKRSQQLALEQK